jgi:hypothetical protein
MGHKGSAVWWLDLILSHLNPLYTIIPSLLLSVVIMPWLHIWEVLGSNHGWDTGLSALKFFMIFSVTAGRWWNNSSISHGCFLPHPFQFITQSLYHWAVYSLVQGFPNFFSSWHTWLLHCCLWNVSRNWSFMPSFELGTLSVAEMCPVISWVCASQQMMMMMTKSSQ